MPPSYLRHEDGQRQAGADALVLKGGLAPSGVEARAHGQTGAHEAELPEVLVDGGVPVEVELSCVRARVRAGLRRGWT